MQWGGSTRSGLQHQTAGPPAQSSLGSLKPGSPQIAPSRLDDAQRNDGSGFGAQHTWA
ncbi:hypothetical protein BH24PSE2_BH24PSE2_08550 [soil metagenome]